MRSNFRVICVDAFQKLFLNFVPILAEIKKKKKKNIEGLISIMYNEESQFG